MNEQTNTPAEPLTDDDWQAILDILDNPFLNLTQLESELINKGYKIVKI